MVSNWFQMHVASCASTNDEVKRWIGEGGSGAYRFVADAQTAGRGRLGRAWFSRENESLLVSFGFPSPLAADKAAGLTLVGAVALSEALEDMGLGAKLEIKWPNDILSDGKKVAGILTEWVQSPSGQGWVVMGMGVNLSIPGEAFPSEIQARATSLADELPSGTAEELADRVQAALATHLRGIQETGEVNFKASAQRMRMGREVCFTTDNEARTGQVVGLDVSGGLRLLLPDGKEHVIFAGDVEPVEWR